MDNTQNRLEGLVDEVHKLESALGEVEEKLDILLQQLVDSATQLGPRDEKKLRYQVEDLEKEETKLEEQYCKKRLEIVSARQKLRSKILDGSKQEDSRLLLSTLFTSTFVKTASKDGGSRRNLEVEIGRAHNSSGTEEDVIAQWNLNPKELEIDRNQKLGSGAFGDVFKGVVRGKNVAIKKLVFQELDDDTLNEFKKEVSVMVKLRHPNVLLFMGACTSKGNLAMVTELMPRGSVYDQLKQKQSFRTRMMFAKDTALGMNWLHCSNILHLDLKTQNLLVDESFGVKIADFGLSKIKEKSKAKGKAGSPLYMAPEMLLDQGYDEKADVYSYGIVLWELLTEEEPYKGKFNSFEEMVEAVTKNAVRPDIPEGTNPKLKQLIQSCWNPSPANRPSFAQILKSNVLDEVTIEVLIREPNMIVQTMWKTKFLEKSYIPWQEFLVAFSQTLGFPIPKDPEDITILCLKELIAKKDKNNKEMVPLEDFAKMLEWFGPVEKGNGILRRIENRLRTKGFFGMIETVDAEKKLNGTKKGTYLIRFSTGNPGAYAITVNTGTLKHYRVLHRAGEKYVLGVNEYDDLDALIKAHKKDLSLKEPATGSKYEAMFVANDKRLATQGYMPNDFSEKKK